MVNPAELEAFLRIARPPLSISWCAGTIQPRPPFAAEELATVERIRGRLAREGWWN